MRRRARPGAARGPARAPTAARISVPRVERRRRGGRVGAEPDADPGLAHRGERRDAAAEQGVRAGAVGDGDVRRRRARAISSASTVTQCAERSSGAEDVGERRDGALPGRLDEHVAGHRRAARCRARATRSRRRSRRGACRPGLRARGTSGRRRACRCRARAARCRAARARSRGRAARRLVEPRLGLVGRRRRPRGRRSRAARARRPRSRRPPRSCSRPSS